MNETKPDEDSLWREDFLVSICEEFFTESNGAVDDNIWAALEKVREETARIKDAECQEKIGEVIKLGDEILEFSQHGDYSDGVEAWGKKATSVKEEWQALKKELGGK